MKKFVKKISQTFFVSPETYPTLSLYCVKKTFYDCANLTKISNRFLHFCVTQKQTTNKLRCAYCTNTPTSLCALSLDFFEFLSIIAL